MEVYNPTDIPVPLENWYISDDAANLKKHRLKGNGMVEAGSYKCIFFDHNAQDGQYGANAGKQVRFKLDRTGGTTLRYTLDGSTPTLADGMTSDDGLFEISKSTVLRLRLFAEGYLPSGVVTRTYIYKDKPYYLPIVAIATAPCNLYDDMIGCYVNGKNGIPERGNKNNSNLNMDWVRPVNFEYLTADGNQPGEQF